MSRMACCTTVVVLNDLNDLSKPLTPGLECGSTMDHAFDRNLQHAYLQIEVAGRTHELYVVIILVDVDHGRVGGSASVLRIRRNGDLGGHDVSRQTGRSLGIAKNACRCRRWSSSGLAGVGRGRWGWAGGRSVGEWARKPLLPTSFRPKHSHAPRGRRSVQLTWYARAYKIWIFRLPSALSSLALALSFPLSP